MTHSHVGQLVVWSQKAVLHTATRAPFLLRPFFGLAWLFSWLLWPLLYLTQALLVRNPRVHYYLNDTGDCVLAIKVTNDGWKVFDHLSSNPGTEQGRALRAALLPTLERHADQHHVPIILTAANTQLAATYAKEMLGLEDRGRAFPRGRRMQRDPRSTVTKNHD